MKIKFLHLNIEWSRFPEKVSNFIKENDIDIVNLQEVTGGKLNEKSIDTFEYFKQSLGYRGELVKNWSLYADKNDYFGNTTLFRNPIELVKKEVVWLKEFMLIPNFKKRDIKEDPRSAMSLTLRAEGKKFNVINTHLAWGPTPEDEPYKMDQARKLYAYMLSVKYPFILSGDFNVTPDSKIVKMIEKFGDNLTTANNIPTTLNSKLHRFPNLSYAVDYIFIPKNTKYGNFKLIDEDLSDHYGLFAEIEL